jgi:hypothetical protein
MSDTEILVDTIEAQVNSTREVDTVTETGATVGGIVHVPTIEQESIVEVKKSEYSIVGDGLYASVNAEEAPAWLMSIIDTTVDSRILNSTQALSNANQSILNALDSIDVAKNSYQELINISATVDQIISSRLQSLDATLNNNNAKIVELQSTMVTPTEAAAMSASLIQASLNNGAIGARIGQVQNTFVNEFNAMAFSIDSLNVELEDVGTGLSGTASALQTMYSEVGLVYGSSTPTGGGLIAGMVAISGWAVDLDSYIKDPVTGEFGGNSTLQSSIETTSDGKIATVFSYDSDIKMPDGNYYKTGFGLASLGVNGVGTSEFWVDADKFRVTAPSISTGLPVFSINGSDVVFNGKVSFINSVTGTESLATKEDILESYYYKVSMDKYASIAAWNSEWYIIKGEEVNRSRTSIGGKIAILFGDNSGDDNVRMVMAKSIPYNPGKVYKISLSYYYTNGSGYVRVGFVGRDREDSVDIRSDGSSTRSTGFHCAQNLYGDTGVWRTVSGYIGGSTTGFTSGVSPITDPLSVNENIKYIRPYIEVNREPVILGSDSGRTYIADFTIEEVTFESAKATTTLVNTSVPTTTTSTSTPPNPPASGTPAGSVWRQGPGDGAITDTNGIIIPNGQYMHYQYNGSSWLQIGGTYIDGSRIVTGTIDAAKLTTDFVYTKNINVNNKFTVDSQGNTQIKSGTSGARMEITNNSIKVYDGINALPRVVIGQLS